MQCRVTHSSSRVSLLWQILYIPWLIPWWFSVSPVLLCTCNMILFPNQGPSVWCSTFKWMDERNGAMIVSEGQKLYFEMKAFTTGCDCHEYKRCNRLLNTLCQYSYRKDCQRCPLCQPYKQQKIVFLARNTGRAKTMKADGVTSQSIEPVEVASCKVGPVSPTGVYKGYCWYSNSQASLQPFYTYILTGGGPLMESFVWTTLMAGSVSVSLTTANWVSNSTIRVGERAMLKVTQKDAYGNPISSNTVLEVDCFQFSAYVASDSRARVAVSFENVQYHCDKTSNGYGYVSWYPTTIGKFWLQVGNGATNIRGSPFPVVVESGPLSIKSCTAVWPGAVNTFIAGNVAALKVFQKDSNGNAYSSNTFNFLVKVTTRASGVNVPLKFSVSVEANGVQNFSFNLTLVGEFNIYVGSALGEQISGSPFSFKVIPGAIHIESCTGTWQFFNEFSAGDVAKFLVTQRDSNGNIVSLQNGRNDAINLDVKFSRLNKEPIPLKAAAAVDFVTGIQTIQFASTISGSFNLSVGKGLSTIRNSPFSFKVFPGPIYIPACKGRWIGDINEFYAGTTAKLYVIISDKYGNEFNTSFPFIVNVQTILGMKVEHMPIIVSPGSENGYMLIQLVTKEAGNYYLNVGSTKESISNSPVPFSVRAAALSISHCLAMWEDALNISTAGHMVTLRILQMDAFGNNISHSTGIFGQTASYVTKVIDAVRNEEIHVKTMQEANPATGYHYIKLIPETAGRYLLIVGDGKKTLPSSPFPFMVIPGAISLPNTYAFWEMNTNILKAGIVAFLGMWTKDAYDNTIDARNTSLEFVFKVLRLDAPTLGSRINSNVTIMPERTRGYWLITLHPSLLGKFLLEIATATGNISNSPLLFTVVPGPFSIQLSSGQWEDDVNDFQPPGIARFYLTLRDLGGNILKESVTSIYNLSIQVYEAPDILLSVSNIQMNYTKSSIGNFEVSFSMDRVGKYLLAIGQGNNSLPGSPFQFEYIAGAVDPTKTTLHGEGLNNSIAGEVSLFSVQLRDKSGYPTDPSNTSISVSILRFGDQLELPKNITLVPDSKGLFKVAFIAKVAGQYVLRIRWRGITLHSVPAIYKTVFPGSVYLPNTKVIGSGVERGIAGSYLEFTISFYDALNNSNPEGQVNVSITFIPNMLTSYETTTNNSSITTKYRIAKAFLDPYNLTILAKVFNVTSPIPGSPFQVYIESGPVSTINSLGGWQDDRNTFEVNGMAEFLITPRDIFGNEIFRRNNQPCNCNFSAQIFKKQSSATIAVRDMLIVTLLNSTVERQKLTFSLQKPGEYWLQVGNVSVNILGSPFSFSYVTGLPNKAKSSFTGNGLNDSYAGDISSFIIKARDRIGNPIVSELNLLNVTIIMKGSIALLVNTSRVEGYPGTFVVGYRTYVAGRYTVLIRLMSVLLYQGKKYVYAGPISSRKCKAFGSGLQGGYAGDFLSFHITPYDDFNNVNSRDNISIFVFFTPNVTSLTQLSRNQSGIFLIAYRIIIAQIYSLKIIGRTALTEFQIPGSPFEIIISPGKINLSQSQITGFGLSSLAAVGYSNAILVYLFDSYGNPCNVTEDLLSISISPKSNASVAKFICVDAGQCETSYKVLQRGTYNISLKFNGTHFGGSIFKQIIINNSGSLRPEFCTAQLRKAVVSAGERESAIVHCRDIHGNYFKLQKKLEFTLDLRPRNSERLLNYSFVDHLNGTYTTMFTVYVSGSYALTIRLFGSPIKNNPYQFSVITGPIDVPSCIAYGTGLFRSIADTQQNITLQARDRFQNPASDDSDMNGNHPIFYMRISGKNVDTTVQFVRISNGHYKGVYVLSQTGLYTLSIQSQGKHIYGSPFYITVGADLYNVPKITSHPYLILAFEGIPYMFGSSLQPIQVTYSKPLSLVTMELKAQHGYLYPSEKMSNNWENIKAINPRFDGSNYTLTFSGFVNSVNRALRAFMYQGTNFYNGDDTLFCSVIDQKGSIDTQSVNITIKAVNNPPYIVTANDYLYVDPSEVSRRLVEMPFTNISVGDFDQFDKTDDNEILQMDITLEVDLGTLTITLTSLPAMTAASRKGQNEWKHLDQIIEPNRTVQMIGQGIKFQASIADANAALKTLYYSIGPLKEGNFVDALLISVNDQGNFGCYGDCSNDVKVPLFATAKIIIRTYPSEDNKLSAAKISMITTFTIVASFMGVASGWIWYKWSKKVHIKVEELVEPDTKKQMFYDPLWIPEDD